MCFGVPIIFASSMNPISPVDGYTPSRLCTGTTRPGTRRRLAPSATPEQLRNSSTRRSLKKSPLPFWRSALEFRLLVVGQRSADRRTDRRVERRHRGEKRSLDLVPARVGTGLSFAVDGSEHFAPRTEGPPRPGLSRHRKESCRSARAQGAPCAAGGECRNKQLAPRRRTQHVLVDEHSVTASSHRTAPQSPRSIRPSSASRRSMATQRRNGPGPGYAPRPGVMANLFRQPGARTSMAYLAGSSSSC